MNTDVAIIFQWAKGGIPEVYRQLELSGKLGDTTLDYWIFEPLTKEREEYFQAFCRYIDPSSVGSSFRFLMLLLRRLPWYKLIVANTLFSLLLSFLISSKETKIVFHIHSEYSWLMAHASVFDKLRFFLCRWICLSSKVSKVIGVNKAIICALGKDLSDKSCVIENGVVATQFVRALKEAPYTLVTVGRLSPEKDYSRAIRVFSKIKKNVPDVRLLMLGDGPERSMLESEIERCGLQGSVSVVGHVKSVMSYFDKSVVLLSTSKREGSPLIFGEALSRGVMIASTRVGTARYIFDDQECCIGSDSDEELVHRVSEWLRLDSDEIYRMSQMARMLFEQRFCVNNNQAKLVAIFSDCLNHAE